jgi:RNA-directed DNA polymerase
MYTNQIRAWLKAGILKTNAKEDEFDLYATQGTPQGGILSPLLSNVALHGMETEVLREFGRDKVKIIRYADDFAVLGKELKDVQKANKIIQGFLEPIGLRLSEEKTRIGHTMMTIEGNKGQIGLDFLGFHFRNYRTSKHRGVKNTRGVTQCFRQATKPSRKAMKSHRKNLSQIIKKHKSAPIGSLIAALASSIQG